MAYSSDANVRRRLCAPGRRSHAAAVPHRGWFTVDGVQLALMAVVLVIARA